MWLGWLSFGYCIYFSQVLLNASLLPLTSTCELHNHHLPTPSALSSLCNTKKRVVTMMILKLLLALLMLVSSVNLCSSQSYCYNNFYESECNILCLSCILIWKAPDSTWTRVNAHFKQFWVANYSDSRL